MKWMEVVKEFNKMVVLCRLRGTCVSVTASPMTRRVVRQYSYDNSSFELLIRQPQVEFPI